MQRPEELWMSYHDPLPQAASSWLWMQICGALRVLSKNKNWIMGQSETDIPTIVICDDGNKARNQ